MTKRKRSPPPLPTSTPPLPTQPPPLPTQPPPLPDAERATKKSKPLAPPPLPPGPPPAAADFDDLDRWEEAEEVVAAAPKAVAAWKKWVPKGVKFRNRKAKRTAALAAMAAAGVEGVRPVEGAPILYAAGVTWEDKSLGAWPENDYRLFVGNLDPKAENGMLEAAFAKYPSFAKSRVVKDKKSAKPKVYGFVSFLDPDDFIRAWKEMNGKYIGARPIALSRSKWKDRLVSSEKTQAYLAKQHAKHKLIEDANAAGGIDALIKLRTQAAAAASSSTTTSSTTTTSASTSSTAS